MEDSKILVVLDNLEVLSPEDVNLVSLVSNIPAKSKLLITTRVSLGQWEHRFPLRKLNEIESSKIYLNYLKYLQISPKKVSRDGLNVHKKCTELFHNPLLIKWYLLSLYNGADPSRLSEFSSSFKEAVQFCFSNIFNKLTTIQKELLYTLMALDAPASLIELEYYSSHQDIKKDFNSLHLSGIIFTQMDTKTKNSVYFLNELAKQHIKTLANKEQLNVILSNVLTKRAQLKNRAQQESIDRNTYKYKIDRVSIEIVDDSSMIVKEVLVKTYRTAKNNLKLAINEMESLKAMYPNEAEVFRISGLLNSWDNNLYQAKQDYESAIDLNPLNTLALFSYAKFHDKCIVDFSKALEYINKALEIDDDFTLLSYEALYRSRLGDDKAKYLYNKLLDNIQDEMIPDYYKRSIFDQAIDCFRRSAERCGRLSSKSLFNEDIARALDIIEKAYSLGFCDEKMVDKRLPQIEEELTRNKQLAATDTVKKYELLKKIFDEHIYENKSYSEYITQPHKPIVKSNVKSTAYSR